MIFDIRPVRSVAQFEIPLVFGVYSMANSLTFDNVIARCACIIQYNLVSTEMSSPKKWTASLIERNIQNNLFQTKDLKEAFRDTKRKFFSPAWNKFLAVVDDNNDVLLSHVVCKLCQRALRSGLDAKNTRGNGTSNLLRHSKKCNKTSESAGEFFWEKNYLSLINTTL